jgi:hypothetical protein
MSPPQHDLRLQNNQIQMGPNYTDQFFYSLATNTVLSSNSRFAYDLMFDCNPDSFNIWLNTAKFMSAMKSSKTDFNSVTINDTTNGNWIYERGSYNIDSNALGPWWTAMSSQPISAGTIYIINQGVDESGNPLDMFKMRVNNFSGTSYSITYASLTGTDSGTVIIPKDVTRNYRYLALSNAGQLLNIEPDKSTWDLCFTHYTVVFYEPYYLPYQVTGVLHNPSRVRAYVDSVITTTGISFDSLSIRNFNPALLQSNRDAIGYDWKTWTGRTYVPKPKFVFYIKTGEGIVYKLHFISFTNIDGQKGYPAFEYSSL